MSRGKILPLLSGYESDNDLPLNFFLISIKNWDVLSTRGIIGEHVLNKRSGESVGIIHLLQSVNMMEPVTKPKPFVAAVVYEFYANMSSSNSVVESPQYKKVYVRGRL